MFCMLPVLPHPVGQQEYKEVDNEGSQYQKQTESLEDSLSLDIPSLPLDDSQSMSEEQGGSPVLDKSYDMIFAQASISPEPPGPDNEAFDKQMADLSPPSSVPTQSIEVCHTQDYAAQQMSLLDSYLQHPSESPDQLSFDLASISPEVSSRVTGVSPGRSDSGLSSRLLDTPQIANLDFDGKVTGSSSQPETPSSQLLSDDGRSVKSSPLPDTESTARVTASRIETIMSQKSTHTKEMPVQPQDETNFPHSQSPLEAESQSVVEAHETTPSPIVTKPPIIPPFPDGSVLPAPVVSPPPEAPASPPDFDAPSPPVPEFPEPPIPAIADIKPLSPELPLPVPDTPSPIEVITSPVDTQPPLPPPPPPPDAIHFSTIPPQPSASHESKPSKTDSSHSKTKTTPKVTPRTKTTNVKTTDVDSSQAAKVTSLTKPIPPKPAKRSPPPKPAKKSKSYPSAEAKSTPPKPHKKSKTKTSSEPPRKTPKPRPPEKSKQPPDLPKKKSKPITPPEIPGAAIPSPKSPPKLPQKFPKPSTFTDKSPSPPELPAKAPKPLPLSSTQDSKLELKSSPPKSSPPKAKSPASPAEFSTTPEDVTSPTATCSRDEVKSLTKAEVSHAVEMVSDFSAWLEAVSVPTDFSTTFEEISPPATPPVPQTPSPGPSGPSSLTQQFEISQEDAMFVSPESQEPFVFDPLKPTIEADSPPYSSSPPTEPCSPKAFFTNVALTETKEEPKAKEPSLSDEIFSTLKGKDEPTMREEASSPPQSNASRPPVPPKPKRSKPPGFVTDGQMLYTMDDAHSTPTNLSPSTQEDLPAIENPLPQAHHDNQSLQGYHDNQPPQGHNDNLDQAGGGRYDHVRSQSSDSELGVKMKQPPMYVMAQHLPPPPDQSCMSIAATPLLPTLEEEDQSLESLDEENENTAGITQSPETDVGGGGEAMDTNSNEAKDPSLSETDLPHNAAVVSPTSTTTTTTTPHLTADNDNSNPNLQHNG